MGKIQGTNPIIRVGGNTQDYATFNASQSEALIGSYDFARSRDYPTTISIGPAFFESYSTWEDEFSYLHGFNLANNRTAGLDSILGETPLVCTALNGSKLAYWQLGNEPDLYKTSSQGPVRPAWWNETDYVNGWHNKTGIIRSLVQQHCPEVIEQGKFNFYAPSFAGTDNSLNMITTWQAGLGANNDIAFIDSHNYIGGATQPGVTLQKTLMNHTSTVLSVNKHLNESSILRNYTNIRYLLGETNSLYNEGAPNLSNSFGAALWGVDFNLYCAATGIARVHMHQGTDYRYASWQPIQTVNTTKGTKAPYYGNIMVANALGDLTKGNTSVADLELGNEYNSAYAVYKNDQLRRLVVIQMREYNYTGSSTDAVRPHETFQFQMPTHSHVKRISVQRLMANGSDAITGITFDGLSYNYELDAGKPVRLNNVTQTSRTELLGIGQDGMLSVDVPWSSAAIINFY